MSRLRAALALTALALIVTPALAQKPDATAVLKAAADYLVRYSAELQAVAAEEEYLQMDTGGNKINKVLRLTSDVVFVGLGSGSIFAFRDARAIDTKAVREPSDRLLQLFLAPPAAPASSITAAQRLTDDAGFWFVNRNLQILDSPMAPLELMRGRNQSGSTFTLDSVKKSDGVDVAVLKFKETQQPSVLPIPAGVPVSGRFWVDVASGRVRETEIVVSDKAVNSRYSVKFAADKATGLWLPVELNQQIQISSVGAGGATGFGGTGSFEAHAKYSKFRRLTIDLAKVR